MYVHVRVSRVRVCALAHVCDSDYAQVESDAYHAFAAIRTPGAARLTHRFVKRVVQVAATCVKARFFDAKGVKTENRSRMHTSTLLASLQVSTFVKDIGPSDWASGTRTARRACRTRICF